MKTWYKIVFKLNQRMSFSVFSYESEDEKKAKLQRWKDEHVREYNHIEVIWHGIDEMDFTQKK
jgi:hypothetical protein